MSDSILTPDTQAILLICGSLGQDRGAYPQPLTSMEFSRLAQWLDSRCLQPADLLNKDIIAGLEENRALKNDPRRLRALLNRGGALAINVEGWTNKGLWIMSRYDKDYPYRWIKRLGHYAPALVYGAGNRDLLSKGGLAIVGSRDVSEKGIAVARRAANICSNEGMQIISGGARGVDREAMISALLQGGNVIGVLADSLERSSFSSKYRRALRAGKLTLVSPYDPRASFNVGNAMNRNKLVYCLSDCALVVSSAFGKGGTWAGATENLKRKWVPVFVFEGDGVPDGNRFLIEEGAIGLNSAMLIDENVFMESLKSQCDILLDPEIQNNVIYSSEINDRDQPKEPTNEESLSSDIVTKSKVAFDLFPKVWPFIKAELQSAKTDRELSEIFNVQSTQMRAWLNQAVDCHLALKLKRPTRYVIQKDQSLLKKWEID